MATQKNNEQEQNAIENLNSHLTAAGEKVANNKSVIYWLLGAIIVIAALCAGYIWLYKAPQTKKAQAALDKVEMTAMGNDSIAAVEFAKVANDYSGTDAGNIAALQAATAFYRQGKYNETVKYLDKFKSGDDKVLGAQTQVLKADALVNLKKYDEALGAYDKALKDATGNEQIAPIVLWKKANIYDEQKKYDEALKCYEQIKEGYPTFTFGNGLTIEAYIAREKARLGK